MNIDTKILSRTLANQIQQRLKLLPLQEGITPKCWFNIQHLVNGIHCLYNKEQNLHDYLNRLKNKK